MPSFASVSTYIAHVASSAGICLPCVLHEEDELVLILYYSAAASLFNVGWAAVQASRMIGFDSQSAHVLGR